MKELSSYERMKRMYEHRDADRVPIHTGPWESTIARWRREGLPADVRIDEYLDIDRVAHLGGIDTSPRFPREVLEETDSYIIVRDAWGTTTKNWKPVSSTPYEIDHLITGPDSWAAAKERMVPSRDRIDWPSVDKAYKRAKEQQSWLVASLWFGYDIVNARMIGTETLLLAMAEQPDWVKDVLDTLTDLALALLDIVWAEGYDFHELQWPDDMGYKNGMLFSKRMWRQMVQPYQQRAIDWAHAHGAKAHMHSCGNIMAVVPDLVAMGLDGLNPMEVKAGMDPLGIKRAHGDRLLLQGGLDARKFDVYEEVEADIEEKLPLLMQSGGYCFASDHSIPDSVGLETYKRTIACAKRVGTYR